MLANRTGISIAKSDTGHRPEIRLRAGRKQPRVLAAGDVQAILDACDRLRDRLLFAVLYWDRQWRDWKALPKESTAVS